MESTNPDRPIAIEIENCRDILRVYSDGSISRSARPSFNVPVSDDGSVHHKDLLFDPSHDLRLRLYLPQSDGQKKLPIFYYFHGGGFCIGSRDWPNFHNYCLRLASALPAVVVAPDYRLAPEHRLPAALDDAFASLEWLGTAAAEEEMGEVADFGRVFVSGDSAGGSIAHHLVVRVAGGGGRGRGVFGPARIRAFVLLMPFFGGETHSVSEAECPVDAFLNLQLNDRYWRLSLPLGATRDHPYSNPFGPESPSLEPLELAPMLVVVGGRDLLRDRAADYARKLKGLGKEAELVEFEGMQHGFFTINPGSAQAEELMRVLRRFIAKHAG
ncbi:putative carboxylesterase 15 [Acorus gramineus]|uniref:Carboxylesterase 15 n=1 Tax=Acorus gramineus TaxID=55184 RepID=A0AAV9AFP8_ACOGR|nr:putative carboxylesterase 15 [Acorus gramineus]